MERIEEKFTKIDLELKKMEYTRNVLDMLTHHFDKAKVELVVYEIIEQSVKNIKEI